MGENYVRRLDLDKLYLPFCDKLLNLTYALGLDGTPFFATSGFRSFDEQEAIYAIGRRGIAGERIKTKAKPGYSAHNYGVACDLAKDKDQDQPGLQPDWDDEVYDALGAKAEEIGLEWSGRWESFRERGHIQLPLKRMGFPTERLLAIHRVGGLKAVWDALDTVLW